MHKCLSAPAQAVKLAVRFKGFPLHVIFRKIRLIIIHLHIRTAGILRNSINIYVLIAVRNGITKNAGDTPSATAAIIIILMINFFI